MKKKGAPPVATANSVMQVTAEPATVAVSVNHVNHTHACIEKTGKFAVSILAESSKPLIIGTFGFRSGRDFDKFAGFDTREVDGLQVLNDACGYFVCEVVQKMETETHTVFLGKVVAAERIQKAAPMTYAYYPQRHQGQNFQERTHLYKRILKIAFRRVWFSRRKACVWGAFLRQ